MLPLIAILTAFPSASEPAADSSSSNFSNVSLGAGQAVAAPPSPIGQASEAKPAPQPARPRRPAKALPPPPAAAPVISPSPLAAPPTPPSAPIWPEIALGAALVFAAGVFTRSREARSKRAAGETLAMAAHELKSPLSAIESYLDLMAQDAPDDARGVRLWLEDVRRMKSTASHLRRTIGDILDMTRIEDGRLKLSPRPVPLGPLLTEVAEEYGALARKRGVSIVAKADPGVPDAAADPDRLRQVLHNLLDNALKFTPAGGSVHLSAKADDARLAIDVRDEGVGVPPLMREKLFGKFARLAPALDETEGTGLGLYISRRLVEAQGGRLTYAPGAGRTRKHLSRHLAASGGRGMKGTTILVVDDNDDYRRILEPSPRLRRIPRRDGAQRRRSPAHT